MTDGAGETRFRRLIRIADNRILRTVFPLAVVAIAIAVLHHLSREVSLSELRADIVDAPARPLLLAVLFTAISFVALSLYDVIAVRYVAPGRVPVPAAAAAGAAGYALSNLLGFSYVTGTAARYRIYSGFGLDVGQIALLLAFSWSAFWLGLALAVGGLLAFHPDGLATLLPIPAHLDRLVGLAVLVLLAALFLRLRFGREKLSLFGITIKLPRLREAAELTGASVIDISASALVLYVLLPTDLVPSVPYFFVVYIAALALGILSHAPGGIGVFEATVLAALGAGGRSDALAALLLYRVVYTGLPFLVAVIGLSIVEIGSHRERITPAIRIAYKIVRPVVPMIAGGIALLSGVVLLVSGNLPTVGERLSILEKSLPLGVVELSHLAGSVAGVMLLIVARGLYRRLYRAWLVTMGLLGAGFVASLAKGIDIEEATLLALGALFLWLFRHSFYRVRGAAPLHLGLGWFLSVAALFVALTWLGFFAYKHVEYRDALWWQVSWHGDASRFLRASLAGAVVLAATALGSLIGASVRRHKPEPIPDVVRKLVAESSSAEASLALLGDKSFLVDPGGRAFISFADTGGALVTKGDPVGEEAAGRDILWQFREMADREGKRPVFYAVSSKYVSTFLDMGLTVVKFGEIASVDLTGFTLDVPAMRDFRQAHNKAAREGCVFEIVPAADVPHLLGDLKRVSDAWLARKQGQEKGFALGFFDAAYLGNFDHAVLREGEGGRIVAFANLMQGAREELSIDLMRYDPDGPKFAMDALFAGIMLWGKAQGFRWFNLGAVPFSGAETNALASVWQRLGGFVYEHGETMYHFEGLRSFKEKFQPDWAPNYIACQDGLGVARAFMDANLLISGGVAGLVQKSKPK
ncbi:bifunctional lysylphosphatidylglycerol flippase/synthetase MprF [Oricola sp.]|uniref:bifunctional lysylphosphatidylglycerol flippase/synthetase MprF n=1 Tax=Oricola sp. TaxID=1979950 RepID=UPI0035149128